MYSKDGIIAGLFIAMVSVLIVIFLSAKDTTAPEPWEISGKCEVKGKCYVEVWHEVTPEEYIGLDVGDEYHPED